jgi:hypothetical protein
VVARRLPRLSPGAALVAQRIEHLATDQKVGGSSPFERTVFLQVKGMIDDHVMSWTLRITAKVTAKVLNDQKIGRETG